MEINFTEHDNGSGRLRLYGNEVSMTITLSADDLVNLREAIGAQADLDLSDLTDKARDVHDAVGNARDTLRSLVSDAESALSNLSDTITSIDNELDDAESNVEQAINDLESAIEEIS